MLLQVSCSSHAPSSPSYPHAPNHTPLPRVAEPDGLLDSLSLADHGPIGDLLHCMPCMALTRMTRLTQGGEAVRPGQYICFSGYEGHLLPPPHSDRYTGSCMCGRHQARFDLGYDLQTILYGLYLMCG